ncbi:hypothetical protein HD599_000572 [Conyzicola lurida]|uniref:Uncharacterized protein n=1 Tax=Conyzicola lurida TaxID=1172621 RepID=A0A841ALD7_9MICO|nr:hypothetical protein [Conyzicola lurida]
MSDEHPELNGYEAGDGKPLRSKHLTTVMRVVVVLALVALVLPGVITTMTVASNTAEAACAEWVAYEVDGASGSEARFEFFGPGGAGWECYSVGAFGGDGHIASLGLIPGPARLPSGVTVGS